MSGFPYHRRTEEGQKQSVALYTRTRWKVHDPDE